MIAFLRKRFIWALFAGAAGYLRRRYRRWKADRERLATAGAASPAGKGPAVSNGLPGVPETEIEPDKEGNEHVRSQDN